MGRLPLEVKGYSNKLFGGIILLQRHDLQNFLKETT